MRGFPPGASRKGAATSATVHRESARSFYAPIVPVVAELREQGLSLRAIARELDRRGVKTRYGVGGWNAAQVLRVLLTFVDIPDAAPPDIPGANVDVAHAAPAVAQPAPRITSYVPDFGRQPVPLVCDDEPRRL